MKITKVQNGSSHLIIIIILTLAVIGLLGFVFWQNFFQKEGDFSEVSSTRQSSVSTDDTKTTATSNQSTTAKRLAVPQFGISLNLPDNDDSYHIVPQDSTAVYISNDALDIYLNSGRDCEIGGVQLVKLPTSSATDTARVYTKDINGYKYGIAKDLPLFHACSGDAGLINSFSAVRDALINELSTVTTGS